jgi:hypothetical protein
MANVALYKYGNYLTQVGDGAFEIDHAPGTNAPFAGIYRCDQPLRSPLPRSYDRCRN